MLAAGCAGNMIKIHAVTSLPIILLLPILAGIPLALWTPRVLGRSPAMVAVAGVTLGGSAHMCRGMLTSSRMLLGK